MITDIRLQHFRSYSDDSFDFSPSVNIIVGPNASGKTNLLEAVLVAAQGSSYRVKDAELIAYNQSWGRLELRTDTNESRVVVIEKSGEKTRKQFKLNDVPHARLTLKQKIPLVIFEPTHLQLLTGSPDTRRQYLDDLLEQTKPGFGSVRRQYARILSQRNALLKKNNSLSLDELFVWNLRLSEFGEQIAQARHELIGKINERLTAIYQELAKSPSRATVTYRVSVHPEQYASNLIRKLEETQNRDMLMGFTSQGPHREDFEVLLNDHPAALTASRGETRTLLLAFKMVEAILLEAELEIKPILLFDDVFSELDGKRRQALTSFLQSYQTFITTTDADVVVQHFTESAHILPLSKVV